MKEGKTKFTETKPTPKITKDQVLPPPSPSTKLGNITKGEVEIKARELRKLELQKARSFLTSPHSAKSSIVELTAAYAKKVSEEHSSELLEQRDKAVNALEKQKGADKPYCDLVERIIEHARTGDYEPYQVKLLTFIVSELKTIKSNIDNQALEEIKK